MIGKPKSKSTMTNDAYYYRARLFPTVLTSIPLFVFIQQVITPLYAESLNKIFMALPLITGLGLFAAILFLSIQINRLIAKEVFQQFFFKEETKMPSTNFLLWNDNFFADETKLILHNKINNDFGILLLDKNSERQNETKARNIIVTAVSQIKNRLRGNTLLLQHNIEYGFIRNFIGGSLLAVVFSLVILVNGLITNDPSLRTTGLILLLIYLLPLLLSKTLVKRYGKYYAKVLLEQYLSV